MEQVAAIPNDMNVKTKLKDFIQDNFLMGADTFSFGDDDSFLEKGVIDSTGVLELVSYIESTFSISVEDEELVPDNLDSVNRLAAYVLRKTRYVA